MSSLDTAAHLEYEMLACDAALGESVVYQSKTQVTMRCTVAQTLRTESQHNVRLKEVSTYGPDCTLSEDEEEADSPGQSLLGPAAVAPEVCAGSVSINLAYHPQYSPGARYKSDIC